MQLPCNVYGLWKTQTHSSFQNTFELEHADDTLTAYSSHSEQKFHSAFVMTTHSRSNSTTHERSKKNESMNCANDIDCSGAHQNMYSVHPWEKRRTETMKSNSGNMYDIALYWSKK